MTKTASGSILSTGKEELPLYFHEWVKRRRHELALTQEQLAKRTSYSLFAIRKIELGERRPSKQLAELLAKALEIPSENHNTFIKIARGELSVEYLPSLILVRDEQSTEKPSQVHGNLPRELTPFIGREPELTELAHLLDNPQCSQLTIVGQGGIGKTRLAIETALQVEASFPDGVWFVSLAGLNSPVQILPAIACVLGLKFQDPTSHQAQLIRYLRAKKALLILDNAEHLLDGVKMLTRILEDCPQVKFMVTSRERLNLLSEWVFEIQGLPVPPNDQVEQFDAYSSVALFLQCARRIHAGLKLEEAERKWVLKICQTMEGMPLGIELSAAWVDLLSCEEIAKEIEHNFDFLSVSMRDLPERQRSLRATLDHSWNLLHTEERLILSRLSVFQGSFSREAAQAICGANLAALSSLKNKTLLYRNEQGYYELHEIVRQYAKLKLAEDPCEQAQMIDRHAVYYVQCLAKWEKALQSSRQLETFTEMARVIDDLSQAWRHMVTNCRPRSEGSTRLCADLLHSALFSISLFYEMRCRSLEAIPLFQESIDFLKTIQPEFEGTEESDRFQSVLGHITAYFGLHHYYIAQYENAIVYLNEAVRLLENSQSRVEKAQTYVMLGSILGVHGQLKDGVVLLEQSREVLREEGAKWWYALSTVNAAAWYNHLGDLQQSEALFQEGFQLVEPGEFRTELRLRYSFAYTLHLKGDHDRAEQLLQESLKLSYLYGNFRFTASILLYLGRVALATQRIDLALAYIQESIQLLTEFGDMWDLPACQLYVGKCYAARDDFPMARCQFLQAIKSGQAIHDLSHIHFGLVCIARTYLAEGQTEKALEISLLLKYFPTEYKTIEEERLQLQADLQAALPKEQVEAAWEQLDGRMAHDQTWEDALALALECITR